MKKQTDIVIVGSGPGGASVARQLARAGKRVILLERGRDYRRAPYYGTYLGALIYADRFSLLFSKEGLNIIRPLMVGGATSMYCGSAARPPAWLKEKYKVDLESYVEETMQEIGIAPLPAEQRGVASTRIAEAALDLGYNWEPLLKFMRPIKSKHFDCGAKCMLGCRCGAKWNAGEWVDDAVAAGCELITEARVDDLIIDAARKQIGGVRGKVRGQPFEIEAKIVVLAAGGIGTPLILQNAGFFEAGHGMTMDTTTMVYGVTKDRGIGNEPPMTYEWANDDVGYLLSTLIDPWLNYPIIMMLKSTRYLPSWARWNQTLGLMIKLKDEVSGRVSSEQDITKPFTAADQKKLDHAHAIAKQILIKAGADPQTILLTPMRGTHPCATVRFGPTGLLDNNLQTEIKNLYVCDASALPESLARPTVLTIIALVKRLAAHLLTP